MSSPIFVTCSVEKGPSGHPNNPINITLCTCLLKGHYQEYYHSSNGGVYRIEFAGCLDSYKEPRNWSYSSCKERDADYDRILKAFAAIPSE